MSETIWPVGDHRDNLMVAGAVDEYVKCKAEAKSVEYRANLAKLKIEAFCEERFADHCCKVGEKPVTPIKVVNVHSGLSIAYVVQDKSLGHALKGETLSELRNIIGEDIVESATESRPWFEFSWEVLSEEAGDGRKVVDVVAEQLRLMSDDLVKAKAITREQADRLLTVKHYRRLRPNFLEFLPYFCDLLPHKFSYALNVLSSAIVRHIKA